MPGTCAWFVFSFSPGDLGGDALGGGELLPCPCLVFLVDYRGTPICSLSPALSHFQRKTSACDRGKHFHFNTLWQLGSDTGKQEQSAREGCAGWELVKYRNVAVKCACGCPSMELCTPADPSNAAAALPQPECAHTQSTAPEKLPSENSEVSCPDCLNTFALMEG